ncbi:MAG: hypothetical protein RBR08_11680 [Desulforegulaceae bacterium]|jgi:hypothetical protein|nr:hypothetical protein [Desulfobacteraceae bacterium]MDY0362105.1 hypothetical protein [Desulforegulaceae bacterium]
METLKNEVISIIGKLPDDITLEDIQYHLYVMEKIRNSIKRAESEGVLTQSEVERKFKKWTIE